MSGRREPGRAREPRAAEPSDPELMAQLAAGEISALGELYDRYQVALRRFIARATCDAADVDDLLHVTFLTAARSAARYDGSASCRPWLLGIAVRLLWRRRAGLRRWLSALGSLRAMRTVTVDPHPALHARGDLERALCRISEAKRVTLLLAEVEGLSGPEIAALLGVPIGTVWTRLHAARRELRRALDGAEAP